MLLHQLIQSYDFSPDLAITLLTAGDMVFALILGIIFGYERTYHGRAAGMRTYGLVCMVAASLTAISGCPQIWFGGAMDHLGPIDPTRTIQGIVTGIGFLGAGIIMKDGLKISGLTTAASIWAAAVIGVMVGLGLHLGAFLLTVLSAGFVMWGPLLNSHLPSRRPVAVTLQFKKGFFPNEESVEKIAANYGYEIARGTISIAYRDGRLEWRFVATSLGKGMHVPVAYIAEELPKLEGVESFHISRAQN